MDHTIDLTDAFFLGLIILASACAWGLAARFIRWLDGRVKRDIDGYAQSAPPTASPSQYGEQPTIPPAIIVHLSLADRDKIREENWQRLKAAMLKHQDAERVANLIREVGGA